DHRGDQHRAPTEPIRQIAHEDRRDTPANAEYTDEIAEILIVDVQVSHHLREQRRQDEAVETDQTERETDDQYRLPFVRGIRASGGRYGAIGDAHVFLPQSSAVARRAPSASA